MPIHFCDELGFHLAEDFYWHTFRASDSIFKSSECSHEASDPAYEAAEVVCEASGVSGEGAGGPLTRPSDTLSP